jgi:LuxR family maltose regulon positive regulatory protein
MLRRFRNWGAPQTSLVSFPDQSRLIEPLSQRELEVLQLIDQGLSNSEIAGQLVVAPSTVKTHINNIYGKLGVRTRLQALKRAEELGLLVS